MTRDETEGRCLVCGAQGALAFSSTDRNRGIKGGPFRYYHCKECGTLSCGNPPEDMGAHYPANYYTLPRSRQELAGWAVHEKFKIDLLTKFTKCGSLIEIGPSNGAFALLAKEHGFDVTVIEVDRRCAESIESILGIRVVQADDEVLALASAGPADAIAMWQVLEHLSRPRKVLETAAQILKPGGILVVATPNPESLQYRLLGRAWVHIDAPRHLVLMPRTAIEKIAREAGFETLLFTVADAGSVSWNDFGWKYSFMPFFRHPRFRQLAKLAATAVGVCVAPLERTASLASSYTIVFRRIG